MLWLLLINKSNFIILVVMPRQLVKSRIEGLTKKTSSTKKSVKVAKQARKILRLAARGSTKGERSQAWVKFQKTYKIKDKDLLAKARAIVQSGSSHTKSFEKAMLKEAGLSGSKPAKTSGGKLAGRGVIKSLPAPEKPVVSESKATKRQRDYVLEREGGLKLSYRVPVKHSYAGTMGIINRVFPGILVQIEAGNTEGVAEIIANAKGDLEAAAYWDYTDTFSAIAALVSRIKKSHSNNANTVTACDNVAKEMKTFYEGNAPDFVGTQTAIDTLVNNLRMSRVQMNTAGEVSVDGVMHKMNLTKAEAIMEERREQEGIYAMEDANKSYMAQAQKAEAEEKDALNRFSAAKRKLGEPETVENLETLKKQKAEAAIDQAAAAKEYNEALAKKVSFQRLYNINDYALKNKKSRFDAGFYGEKRKRDWDVLDYCAKVILRSQDEAEADLNKTETKVNEVLKKLPEVVEKSADLSKDAINSAPSEDKEREVVQALKAEILTKDETINRLDQRAADLEEEIEIIPTLIKAEATKRVRGEDDATGQVLRTKRERSTVQLNEAKKLKAEVIAAREINQAELQKIETARQTLHINQNASVMIREGASNAAEAWTQVRSETLIFNGENIAQIDTFANNAQVNRDLDAAGASILYGVKTEAKIEPLPSKIEDGKLDPKLQELNGRIADDEETVDVEMGHYNELLLDKEEVRKSGTIESLRKVDDQLEKQRQRMIQASERLDRSKVSRDNYIAGQEQTKIRIPSSIAAPSTTTYSEQFMRPIGREAQPRVVVPSAIPLQPQLRSFEAVRPKLSDRLVAVPGSFKTTLALSKAKGDIKQTSSNPRARNQLTGGFLVGGRPDPIMDLQFWKDLYNKRK